MFEESSRNFLRLVHNWTPVDLIFKINFLERTLYARSKTGRRQLTELRTRQNNRSGYRHYLNSTVKSSTFITPGPCVCMSFQSVSFCSESRCTEGVDRRTSLTSGFPFNRSGDVPPGNRYPPFLPRLRILDLTLLFISNR